MTLKEMYKENFSTEELVSLINAYAITVNCMGEDVRFIIKLDTLIDALEEKAMEENWKERIEIRWVITKNIII